jgi:DNA polymerase-1
VWDDSKFAAFDFETSGVLPEYALQPHRVATGQSWVTCVGLAGKSHGASKVTAVLDPDKTRIKHLLDCAARDKVTLVGWNVAFDIAWCCAYGLTDEVMKVQWLDGMLLWRHLEVEPEYDVTNRDKKRSYGLKSAVKELLPQHAGYEENVDFHDTSPEARARLAHYCKKDVVFTLALVKQFYTRLAADPRRLAAALLESRALPLVASAWVEGMLVDTQSVDQLAVDLIATAAKCLEELSPYGVTEKVVRSPKLLAALLFDTWGLKPVKQTDSGANSTDKETLYELAFEDPRAKTLKDYREALGNLTKFSETLTASVAYNGDGRTRPQAAIFGTYSGRMTYYSKQGKNKDERPTGFALHQMKRGKDYRNGIKAPDGYTICEFDAAGQEFRWMAIASGDETMLELCLPGEDAHGFMGSRIVGRDYRELVEAVHAGEKAAKDARQLGKVANLALQYRTSAGKLRSVARVQYGLPMELDEATVIRKTYLQSYPDVPKYWDRQIAECRTSKYVETFAGRRVQLLDSFDGSNGWSLASTAINYRIQGTGADQKYLALAVLRPYMVTHGIRFAWELHDGIYLYVPDAKVAKCIPEIQKMLLSLPYARAWGFTPPIPLPWDAKAGKRWGDLKEWMEN